MLRDQNAEPSPEIRTTGKSSAASASRSNRDQVSAMPLLANSVPGWGTLPPGMKVSAELVHSVENNSATESMVSVTRSWTGTPCAA